jgi:hypothetical protein
MDAEEVASVKEAERDWSEGRGRRGRSSVLVQRRRRHKDERGRRRGNHATRRKLD